MRLPTRTSIFNPAVVLLSLIILFANLATAKVTRIVIDKNKTESPAYAGKSFGDVGQYEEIVGHVYGELDPNDKHNSVIQDIRLAPRNSRGMVEYVTTFTLLKPIDSSKGNKVMLYQVVNRGRRVGSPQPDLGYTYLYSGWQGDIPADSDVGSQPPETIQVPKAVNADGSPVTGPVLARIKNTSGTTARLIVYTRPVAYIPLTLDTKNATLTSRSSETIDLISSPATTIPSADWAWADCTKPLFRARRIQQKSV
jgi:hypothetical protein